LPIPRAQLFYPGRGLLSSKLLLWLNQ